MLGPDTDARPTYQQVTQLTYITQILEGGVAVVAAGAGLWHRAAQGRDHRRQIPAQEEHLRHGIGDGAASRPQRLGTEPRRVRSGEFFPRGRSGAARQCLEAVRQRPARLHRARLCDARGGARDRHDPAALQAARYPSLSDAAEGNADDQAGWIQDQGAPARRQGARQLCRPYHDDRGGIERRTGAARTPRAQHAAIGALRFQPRDRRGTRNPRRRFGRGQRLCHQACSRSTITSASCRSRAAS